MDKLPTVNAIIKLSIRTKDSSTESFYSLLTTTQQKWILYLVAYEKEIITFRKLNLESCCLVNKNRHAFNRDFND